jgi:cytidylate kinase
MSQVPGGQHQPVVTIAALYGASGTVISRRVADELKVPLLDREIPDAVAKRAGISQEAVAFVDEKPRSWFDRLADNLGRASQFSTGSDERLDLQERTLRRYVEDFLAQSAVSGGVVVGRGGMVVLGDVAWALHVYLRGPREARLKVRMAQDGIDRQTAETRQRDEDRARVDYVSRAYGVNGEDATLYHLVLDTTALDLDTCVAIIVMAARARPATPKHRSPPKAEPNDRETS